MMALQYVALLLMCALAATAEDAIASTTTTEAPITEAPDAIDWVFDGLASDIKNETQSATEKQLENDMYRLVYDDYYEAAVDIAKKLVKNRQSYVITSLYDYLIKNHNSNSVSFAYKIWATGGASVVRAVLPKEFQMVFNDSFVYFTHYKHGVGLELGVTPDLAGDSMVYANKEEPFAKRYLWKLEPVSVGRRILFRLRNHGDGRYLKLGNWMDGDGEYQAYGAPYSDNERHLWFFQPVLHNKRLLFFIVNYKQYQTLKLSYRRYEGSYIIYGKAPTFTNDPDNYGFAAAVFNTII